MVEIGRASKPIESVTGVGLSEGEVGVPSLLGGAGRLVAGSESSALSALEVAHPDLRKLLEGLSPHSNVGLTYVIDRETHSVVIKVIDRDTNEILREVPPKEMTELRAAMRDLFGLLFKAEV